MKKLITVAVTVLSSVAGYSQQVVIDTVTAGPAYANQIFYTLESGNEASAALNEWDLAFQTTLMSAGTFVNTGSGLNVYRYPNAAGNTNGFANFDTAGYTGWLKLNNGETSWAKGALNATAGGVNPFDFGWGDYDMITHNVIGDSLFFIQKGNSYYKFWLKEKTSTNSYIFRYATLDGSVDVTDTIMASNYGTKNMIYYSLTNSTTLDREPVAADWQLVFTKYISLVTQPAVAYYPVTGVLANAGVKTAEVGGVADVASFIDTTGAGFTLDMNVIGHDWKSFTPPTGPWVIADSTVFFVLTPTNDLWKLVFTGFGGSSTGRFIFSKQKLSVGTSVAENATVTTVGVYPNPATGTDGATLVYNLTKNSSDAAYTVYDMAGKMIERTQVNSTAGLHTQQIVTNSFAPGLYFVTFTADNTAKTLKLIVR